MCLKLELQVTISAPYIHAAALEVLADHLLIPGCVALDIGCGSGVVLGYMTRIIGESGTVVGIEVVQELVTMSISNLRADGFCPNGASVSSCRLHVHHGDGWAGASQYAPFHAIHVGAAAPEVRAGVTMFDPHAIVLYSPLKLKLPSFRSHKRWWSNYVLEGVSLFQ